MRRRILAIAALLGLTTALSGALFSCSSEDCDVFCASIDAGIGPAFDA